MSKRTAIPITDIDGFRIGSSENPDAATGVTVVVCEHGASAGVSVRGGGPATRETELLSPNATAEKIHAVVLSGGSAFGLNAGGGVMKFLEERGIGYETAYGIVPLVCGASLYDIGIGDGKIRPDMDMGYAACESAFSGGDIRDGCFGAGTGATIGKYRGAEFMMKSGIGTAAVQIGKIQCGAIAAVNALGDVIDVDGTILAGMRSPDGVGFANTAGLITGEVAVPKDVYNTNTTLGIILTNADITKSVSNRVAAVAHDGFARAISPVHTSADGDAIFTMASGTEAGVEINPDALAQL
ncbi:MAG: P1 family peptidase [Clostridiales Family XIII bacterium]|jgi:L-aminopeptidase/D-esterase-like protein|nr:P1 family peptidase [Clostridiales Family XIII bacterium]